MSEPFKMKGHSLPGINQRKSPVKQEITKMPKKGPERLATSETGRDIQKTDSSEFSWNPNASKEVTKKQDEKFSTKAAEKKYIKKAKMPS